MKNEPDYLRDIAEIRSIMERSSRFLSLSGRAGILAGIYALAGAGVARYVLHFDPAVDTVSPGFPSELVRVIVLAAAVLLLALGSAVYLSMRKAGIKGERSWNATSRRLLAGMGMPLVAGGIVVLILLGRGEIEMIPSFTLLFYGLGLYSAGNFTYGEIRYLGVIQVALGLVASLFPGTGMLCWATGFGIMHIVYGLYIHKKYER